MTQLRPEVPNEFSAFMEKQKRIHDAQMRLNERFRELNLGNFEDSILNALAVVNARRNHLISLQTVTGEETSVSYVDALGSLLSEKQVGEIQAAELGVLWERAYGENPGSLDGDKPVRNL